MKFKTKFKTLIMLSVMVVMLTLAVPTVTSAATYDYLPTGDVTDAKFLSVAGTGVATLVNQPVAVYVTVPGSESDFELGWFDGDTCGGSACPDGHWDLGTAEIVYTLYADPLSNGSTADVIGTWTGNGTGGDNSGSPMPDNDWFSVTPSTGVVAQSPGGDYVYRLEAQLENGTLTAISDFKLRTTGTLSLALGQPFSFEGGFRATAQEIAIVYPSYPPNLTPTTYDGEWSFFMDVDVAPDEVIHEITVWDGDLDFGSWDGSTADTDDPDTPDDVLPLFATPGTALEGAKGMGNPADDYNSAGYSRSPSIWYQLIGPGGEVWDNDNPSGNSEWEKFTIRSNSHAGGCDVGVNADYCVDSLDPGTYELQVHGVDLYNLNSFNFVVERVSEPAEQGEIKIIKEMPCCKCRPCPEEVFTFQAKQDDTVMGEVTITGAGEAVIDGLAPGTYNVCEVLEAGSVYEQQPCQEVTVEAGETATVTFRNEFYETGKIRIVKWFKSWYGPRETFTFQVWQDSELKGEATITGPGGWWWWPSATISGLEPGTYTVKEILQAGSAYQQPPDQTVTVRADRTATVYFYNKLSGGGCCH